MMVHLQLIVLVNHTEVCCHLGKGYWQLEQ